MKYNNFMIDLETTGTDAGHSAIIQIAGVGFNLENRDVHPKFFDQALAVPKNRFWDEDTRDWWCSLDPHIFQGIFNRMRDPLTVLREFNAWVAEVADGEVPVLWAKPTHFEYPFLESYYRQFELAKPFHYRATEDLNSWCRARGMPDLDGQIEFEGDAHNAIHDVLHQVKTLFELMDRTDVSRTS